MDVKEISEINRLNGIGKEEGTPVLIRKRSNETEELLVVCIGCTKTQYLEIKETNTLDTSLLNQLKGVNFPSENYIDKLIFLGDLKLFREYGLYVYKFPKRKTDVRNNKPYQYRYYTKSIQEQKNLMCYISSLCNTAKDSWNSVIRRVNRQYGIVFTYKVPKEINEE